MENENYGRLSLRKACLKWNENVIGHFNQNSWDILSGDCCVGEAEPFLWNARCLEAEPATALDDLQMLADFGAGGVADLVHDDLWNDVLRQGLDDAGPKLRAEPRQGLLDVAKVLFFCTD